MYQPGAWSLLAGDRDWTTSNLLAMASNLISRDRLHSSIGGRIKVTWGNDL